MAIEWQPEDMYKAAQVVLREASKAGYERDIASVQLMGIGGATFMLRLFRRNRDDVPTLPKVHAVVEVTGWDSPKRALKVRYHEEPGIETVCETCLDMAPPLQVAEKRFGVYEYQTFFQCIPEQLRQLSFCLPSSMRRVHACQVRRSGDHMWLTSIMDMDEQPACIIDFRQFDEFGDEYRISEHYQGRYFRGTLTPTGELTEQTATLVVRLLHLGQSLVVTGDGQSECERLADLVRPLVLGQGLTVEPHEHVRPGDYALLGKMGVVVKFRTHAPYIVAAEPVKGDKHLGWTNVSLLAPAPYGQGLFLCSRCGRGETSVIHYPAAKQSLCSGCWFKVEPNVGEAPEKYYSLRLTSIPPVESSGALILDGRRNASPVYETIPDTLWGTALFDKLLAALQDKPVLLLVDADKLPHIRRRIEGAIFRAKMSIVIE